MSDNLKARKCFFQENIAIKSDMYDRDVIFYIKNKRAIVQVKITSRTYKRITRGWKKYNTKRTSSKIQFNRRRNENKGGKNINIINKGSYYFNSQENKLLVYECLLKSLW